MVTEKSKLSCQYYLVVTVSFLFVPMSQHQLLLDHKIFLEISQGAAYSWPLLFTKQEKIMPYRKYKKLALGIGWIITNMWFFCHKNSFSFRNIFIVFVISFLRNWNQTSASISLYAIIKILTLPMLCEVT